MPLNLRHRTFCAEYMIDNCGSAAAIRAGYSPKVAATIASNLLKRPDVQEHIAELNAARAARTQITADRVLAELGRIAFANALDYIRISPSGEPIIDLSRLTRDQAAAIVEATIEDYVEGRGDNARDVRRVRIKLADKHAALVSAGRHLGMFTDRIEVQATVQDVIATVAERKAKARARKG